MKKNSFFSMFSVAAVVVLLAALTLPSFAATPVSRTTAQIPFAFDAGGISMPAGKYYFETHPSNGLLILTDPSGRNRAWLTVPLGNPSGTHDPRIVFERRGSNFRLAQIWTAGSALGAGLPWNKKKDRLASGEKAQSEFVIIALRRE